MSLIGIIYSVTLTAVTTELWFLLNNTNNSIVRSRVQFTYQVMTKLLGDFFFLSNVVVETRAFKFSIIFNLEK